MNTPAHVIFGLTAFARPGQRGTATAAVLGALAPDLSLYVLAGGSIFVLGISPQRVFNELYFSDHWQLIFAIDNSFLLWGLGLAIAWAAKRAWAVTFASAGLLHLALDFPLHHDDGRPHFWPVSDWIFESPVSYWDSRHSGDVVGLIEGGLVAVFTVLLFRRFRDWPRRATVLVFFGLELWIVAMWLRNF